MNGSCKASSTHREVRKLSKHIGKEKAERQMTVVDAGLLNFGDSHQLEDAKNEITRISPDLLIGGSTARTVNDREMEWLSKIYVKAARDG